MRHPGNGNKAGAFWAGGAESRGIPRGRVGPEAPQAGPLSLPSTEEPRTISGGFQLLGMDLQHPSSSHTSTLAKWGAAERPLPQVGCRSRAPSLLCAERAQVLGSDARYAVSKEPVRVAKALQSISQPPPVRERFGSGPPFPSVHSMVVFCCDVSFADGCMRNPRCTQEDSQIKKRFCFLGTLSFGGRKAKMTPVNILKQSWAVNMSQF